MTIKEKEVKLSQTYRSASAPWVHKSSSEA
jgi:hypothetical protein